MALRRRATLEWSHKSSIEVRGAMRNPPTLYRSAVVVVAVAVMDEAWCV